MKISVIGGGNAGCFTALVFAWHLKDRPEHEVEPDNDDLEVLFLENLSEYYKDEGVDK